MKLSELCSEFKYECLSGSMDVDVRDVIYDSRKITEGTVFVCMVGAVTDGHKYIPDAVKKGASAIVVERADEAQQIPDQVTVIQVESARRALAYMSAALFGHPDRKLVTIGITGTKGKTTTTYMIKSVLEMAGKKVGLIGTIGAMIGDEHIPSKNTTPESYERQHSDSAKSRYQVPIVRETGGLRDTVKPYNEYENTGDGFSFANYNGDEMLGVINYSKHIYFDRKKQWNQIGMFFCCPYDALGSTMATYGGQNVGAKKLDRLSGGLKAEGILGIGYSILAFVVLWLCGNQLAMFFVESAQAEVIANVRLFLVCNSAFYIPLAFVNIVRFLIQGMGYSKFAILAGVFEMAARTLVGFVFVPMFGYPAACFASPVAWIFADCFLFPAYFHVLKKTKKMLSEPVRTSVA